MDTMRQDKPNRNRVWNGVITFLCFLVDCVMPFILLMLCNSLHSLLRYIYLESQINSAISRQLKELHPWPKRGMLTFIFVHYALKAVIWDLLMRVQTSFCGSAVPKQVICTNGNASDRTKYFCTSRTTSAYPVASTPLHRRSVSGKQSHCVLLFKCTPRKVYLWARG